MKFRRVLWLAVLLILAAATSSCRPADLVSLSSLSKGTFYVRDKFGNQVKVPDAAGFLAALKSAKAVADPTTQGKTLKTDYVLLNDSAMVYYDDDGKYLVYTDGSQKRHVFQGDLSPLIAALTGLPPKVTAGTNLDPALSPAFTAISKSPEMWAAQFESGGKQVIMVTAGEKPTGGYTLGLENVAFNVDGTLGITIRLTAPSGAAPAVVSYPYLELAFAGDVEPEVRMVSATSSGDKVDHVSISKVDVQQGIIPIRPERGSLLTERTRVCGFVKAPAGAAQVEIDVEDGHNVLGTATVSAAAASPNWAYFQVQMDLAIPTSPYGAVVFRSSASGQPEEVIVPISFGGK